MTEVGNRSTIEEALLETRQRLLDLSNRNRLLNYKESSRCIEVLADDPSALCKRLLEGSSTYQLLERLDAPAPELDTDSDQIESTWPAPAEGRQGLRTPFRLADLRKRLKSLEGQFRANLEESGANDLYLALGFLRYREREDSEGFLRAPLLLIPVRLERRRGNWDPAGFTLSLFSDELDSNHSLAARLAERAAELPLVKKDEEDESGEGFDPSSYLAAVETAIERFADEGWHVEHKVVLSLLRFQKQVIWHDLDPGRWPKSSPVTDKPMIKRILLGPAEGQRPPGMPPEPEPGPREEGHTEEYPLVRDADSSQLLALQDALTSKDGLVIQGPPGTGKSQTITNIIAVALAAGRSVLFVAEKMAALDVVTRRLTELGLDPFCLDLHGVNANKKEILESVKKRLEVSRTASPQGVTEKRKALEDRRGALRALSTALSKLVGPRKLPAHAVVWHMEKLRQQLPTDLNPSDLSIRLPSSQQAFQKNYDLLADYTEEWARIPADVHACWRGFRPERYDEGRSKTVTNALTDTAAILLRVRSRLDEEGPQHLRGTETPLNRVIAWRPLKTAPILPEAPDCDASVLHDILATGALHAVSELLDHAYAFLVECSELHAVVDLSGDDLDSFIQSTVDQLEQVSGVCDVADATLQDLPGLAAQHEDLIAAIRSALDAKDHLQDLYKLPVHRRADLVDLLEATEPAVDAPIELALHGRPELATDRARAAADAGKKQTAELTRQLAALDLFDASRVRDLNSLDESTRTLADFAGTWFPSLRREYREARAQVRALLLDPKRFERQPEFIDQLRQLHGAVSSCEKFKKGKRSANDAFTQPAAA